MPKSSSKTTVIKPNVNKGFLYEVKKNWALFVMLIPGVLVLVINNYIPMFGDRKSVV